jgi:hypothetical protein
MKLTTNHYIKYYEQHQNKKKIVDFRAFTTEIETIFRILAKNGYIECITGKGVDKVTKYIRRENIDIKSVTDKKLLTLVAV